MPMKGKTTAMTVLGTKACNDHERDRPQKAAAGRPAAREVLSSNHATIGRAKAVGSGGTVIA